MGIHPHTTNFPTQTFADMDISSLSEGQQVALGTYTSVTNQEASEAIPLLQRSEWNVQVRRGGEPCKLRTYHMLTLF